MALRVTGKGVDVGDALRERITDRCEQVVSKYFDGDYQGHITVEKESASSFKLVCALHLSSGRDLRLDERGGEAYATFDIMATHLEKKLRRYKRRLKDHHIGKRDAMARSYVISSPLLDETDASAESTEAFEPLIISEEPSSLPLLSVGEAVMELDLSGHDVLVFRRQSEDSVQIVHRRQDGHIGWVDTSREDLV